MNPMQSFEFALVNYSTLVDMATLEKMAEAGVKICNEQFCSQWGFAPIKGRAYAQGDEVPDHAILFAVVDEDTQVAGALGWHDESSPGFPDAVLPVKPTLDAGGGLLDAGTSGLSFASVFCHELFEVLVDPFVDDWVAMTDGRYLSKESADPVESILIPITLDCGTVVQMSDGVLPSYFDQEAPTDGSVSFDLAGSVTRPFQLLPGGYQIVFDPKHASNKSTGGITEIYGDGGRHPAKKTPNRYGRSANRTTKHLKRLASMPPRAAERLAAEANAKLEADRLSPSTDETMLLEAATPELPFPRHQV